MSAIPRCFVDKHAKPAELELDAASNTIINTSGEKWLKFEFVMALPCRRRIKAIMGANFLRNLNLLIDVSKKRVVDGKCNYFAMRYGSSFRPLLSGNPQLHSTVSMSHHTVFATEL